jgi:putative oxidoreductase
VRILVESFLNRLQPTAHGLLRIIVGFAYWTHGTAKLFAWFGADGTVELMSRWGAAGVIETVFGAAIIIGFKTRYAAFIASGEMAVAYFWIHSMGSESIWHWANRGELVLVFCFVFFFLATAGSGPWSIDEMLKKRQNEG